MSTQGWNKCDDCGKFAKPEEMMFDELRSMDLRGNLREEYPQYHKDGFGCAAQMGKEKE